LYYTCPILCCQCLVSIGGNKLNNQRLKAARKRTSFTQKELASFLDIKFNSYQSYEAGKRQPNLDVLVKIADLLCVSTDYLLDRDDDDRHEKYLLELEKALLKDSPKGFVEHYRLAKAARGLSVDILVHELIEREKYEQLEKDPEHFDEYMRKRRQNAEERLKNNSAGQGDVLW